MRWVDTHCHLDAPEFERDRTDVVARARAAGVQQIVLPAVDISGCEAVRRLAHAHGLAYALGIHPLAVESADDGDLERLRAELDAHRGDPRLVAVGEIGIDLFVEGLDVPRQVRFFSAQLRLAREFGLPVIVHVRRSADALLKELRRLPPPGGIAHAFNGSEQQARTFVDLGLRLGFGGAMTFERALQIRRLAAGVPSHAVVLETDAPDIPPQWLYRTAAQRNDGCTSRNEPAELPRIARTLAELRGWTLEEAAAITWSNACSALPALARLDGEAVAA
jgi:TatD DNase family protein